MRRTALFLARTARRLCLALLLLSVAAAGALAFLQTPLGRDVAARMVARTVSGPGYEIDIQGLEGTFPFDMRARRIEVADARGVWLALDSVHLNAAAGELLRGRVRIRAVTAARLDIHRLPEMPVPAAPRPWSERLRLPTLPLPVALDRFAVERIALGEAVLGEAVAGTAAGKAELHADATKISLDLRRTDGAPGRLDLSLRQSGAAPTMELRLVASEPTGVLLGRWLHGRDRTPFSLSLTGEGPIADWHGRLDASAGSLARVTADIALSAAQETRLSLTGAAAVAPLLPAELAALAGPSMPIAGRAHLQKNGAISIDELSIGLAAGRIVADAVFAGADRAIAAHIRASLPDLAAAAPLFGGPAGGSAELSATISGTEDRPNLMIEASGQLIGAAGFGATHAEARASVAWSTSPAHPSARLVIAAGGELRGIATPGGLPAGLDRDLRWSMAANAAPDASTVELGGFALRGAGIDIGGTGKVEEYGQVVDGSMRIRVAELGAFSGIVGRPISGELTLDLTARRGSPDRILATIDGSLARLDSGIPALDALAGRSVAISGMAEREPDGTLRLQRLALSGHGLGLEATGSFDPLRQVLSGTLTADIPDLRPAGAMMGTAVSGRLSARLEAEGPIAHPRVRARLDGRDLQTASALLDVLRLDAEMADAARPEVVVAGSFRSGELDGTLSLTADAGTPGELAIRRMQVKAAGGVLEADLRIDTANMLVRGKVAGRAPDLAAWSRLAGVPVAGSIDFTAGLEARTGQGIDLKLTGNRLSSGAEGSRVSADRVAVTARLGDVLGRPSGETRASVTGVRFSAGELSSASLILDAPKPGRFSFRMEAKGSLVEPLAISGEGSGETGPRSGDVELRVARFEGTLGPDRFRLTRPLTMSRRGDDLALSGLALALGGGRLTGSAARRGNALSLELSAQNLPVASAARLAGYPNAAGTVALDASLGGTLTAPRGRFSLSGRSLSLAVARDQRLPSLALDLSGAWNGRDLDLNGRVSGAKGDALKLSGSLPLALDPQSFGITVPQRGRLALRLSGGGDIASLADLLPLGEDRFAGRFALDAAIDGTVSAPAAGGRLTIADGRYENFATGAVLAGIRADIAGDRDRVVIREFSARDGDGGSLAARGGFALAGAGQTGPSPSADLLLTLKEFRVLGRDVARVKASGTVAITGPIGAPKVVARLSTDGGELTIPSRLPPSVTRIEVVEINSRTGKPPASAAAARRPPALPASLDIELDVPGRVFVRGRGLDSEWRGRIRVTGTTVAPQLTGSLAAIRGTFDFLGKTFRVSRGEIVFDGGPTIDPVLDITAEVAAADITAQVSLKGAVSSPAVSMSSTPAVPQDEILSRVLFGRGLGRITAAEGIQVAQAAATLAGGGFDVLGQLRSGLGLDRLVFGAAPSGLATGNLNPAAGGSAASGMAISGGKYVADGVYVGASQGLTPDSSKVIVEIEVWPRVSVQGDISRGGGSGIGLNYKYDY